MPSPPIRFSPDLEQVAPDEATTIAELDHQLDRIQQVTARDTGHGFRAVHAKGHGVARGTLTVLPDLPPELAQGVFATPGSHPAVLRWSTNAGDILDDSVSLPRGLAIKLFDVDGERLPGAEGSTQDMILVNGPDFQAPDMKAFLSGLKHLVPLTDKAQGAKKLFSAVASTVEGALESVGFAWPKLHQMGGAPNVHPLGDRYYTKTAYRYGDHVAKLGLFPASDALTALTGEPIDAVGHPDALRTAIDTVLAAHGGRWELRVQLCTDRDAMPVEDPTVHWDEEVSPYRTVATIQLPPQRGWQAGTSEAEEDALSFNIWNGLAAHRPLGSINRARRETYARSAERRGEVNGCPMHVPAALAELA